MRRIDRAGLLQGLISGPPLAATGLLGIATFGLWQYSIAALWGLLVFPTVALLVAAAVAAMLRRPNPARWVSMAIGTTTGTLALVVIVVGGINAIAWMISDPVPQ